MHGSYCHDRFCLPCAQARSRTVAANLHAALQNGNFRLLTLTLHSTTEPLADLIKKLYVSFRKLRRLPWWTDRVTGGAAFLEVKWNDDKQRWHPHLHCILDGRYLSPGELVAHWWNITGDSYIVDIRAIRDKDEATRYVSKYASKPMRNSFINRPDRLDEAIVALHGRRLILTFGTWSKLRLTEATHTTTWYPIAPLTEIITAAANGSIKATQILDALRSQLPCKPRPTKPDG